MTPTRSKAERFRYYLEKLEKGKNSPGLKRRKKLKKRLTAAQLQKRVVRMGMRALRQKEREQAARFKRIQQVR